MPGIEDFLIPGGEFIISGLESLFGKSPDDERQARYRKLLESYRQAHQQAIQRSVTRTAGLVGQSRQGAAERAAVLGRTGQAESYILPAEQRAQQVGTESLDRVNQFYDDQELGIERDFAQRPIEPNIFDYAKEALGTYGEIVANRKLTDAIGKGSGDVTSPTTLPSDATYPQPEDIGGTASIMDQSRDLENSSARQYGSTFKRRKKLTNGFEEAYNSSLG